MSTSVMVPILRLTPETTQTIPYSLRRREMGSRILSILYANNDSRKLVKTWFIKNKSERDLSDLGTSLE